MKPTYLYCCALGLIIIAVYTVRAGDEIKIYATGRNIGPVVEHLNSLVAAQSLKFRIVEEESDADISVNFQDDIGDSSALGISYPLIGRIYVANSVPADQVYVVLIHEFLHCAGVSHEPEDPTSVMYTHSQRQGQLKKWHARYLKRLVGITTPERIVAQLRLVFL